MGAMSRTFFIPRTPEVALATGSVRHDRSAGDGLLENADDAVDDCFQLVLHEPALTADNLGLKTWASSYLLAKRLVLLRTTLPSTRPGESVLELGAGTGLVGMAAAVVLQAHVYLTDLPEIVPNLELNIRANRTVLIGSTIEAKEPEASVLDWSDPGSFVAGTTTDPPHSPHAFPLILAADPIYSSDHPRLLVNAIGYHLNKSTNARVVLEMPLRDAYAKERKDLRQRMDSLGLVVADEGEEIGYDDWADGCDEDELAEVRCWWTVWRWKHAPAAP